MTEFIVSLLKYREQRRHCDDYSDYHDQHHHVWYH